jgi:membrane protease YdiL (CAAX protease family)
MAVEDILSLAFLTAFGMMLGVIFAKTRSLFPPFLVHAIHNFSLG